MAKNNSKPVQNRLTKIRMKRLLLYSDLTWWYFRFIYPAGDAAGSVDTFKIFRSYHSLAQHTVRGGRLGPEAASGAAIDWSR